MRVFLDANNLFSAAYRDRFELPVFFDPARNGIVRPFSSASAVEEGRRNIASKRPNRTAADERRVADLDASAAPSNQHLAIARQVELPPKDVQILAAALAARADLLVTGDRTHFDHLFGRSLGHLVAHRPTDALSSILLDAGKHLGRPKTAESTPQPGAENSQCPPPTPVRPRTARLDAPRRSA